MKTPKNTLFWSCEEREERELLLINIYVKFKFLCSIWRGNIREADSKHKKNRTQIRFFGAVSGCKRAEKLKSTKDTPTTPNTFLCRISIFQISLEGR